MAKRKQVKVRCESTKATIDLGRRLAFAFGKKPMIFLSGEIGSGKTTFAKGVLQGLGVNDEVTSPSYTLVETYSANGKSFYHMDCYRCKSPTEWLESGLSELMDKADFCLVEWPENAAGLPVPDLEVSFAQAGSADTRQLSITANTKLGYNMICHLK